MPVTLIESFEWIEDTDDLEMRGWYPSDSQTVGAGRSGSQDLSIPTSKFAAAPTGDVGTTNSLIIGFGLRLTGTPNTRTWLQVRDSNAIMCDVRVNAAGTMTVTRGGTVLVTADTNITWSSYSYIELKVLLSDTVGTVDLHIDGVSVGSCDAADTIDAGTEADRYRFILQNGNIDDLYIGNDSDGFDFLATSATGCVVAAQFPTSDADVEFTPSAGGDNFALVDEVPNNQSDYNSSGTNTERDLFGFTAWGISSDAIYGVQAVMMCAKDAPGAGGMAFVTKSGATTDVGDDLGIGVIGSGSVQYGVYTSELFLLDPDGSALWTEDDLDAAQFGYENSA